MTKLITVIIALLGTFAVNLCRADIGGGVLLQVEDGSTHACIDVTKYDVSMMLIALQAARTNTFWKQSKTIGAKFDVVFMRENSRSHAARY
jgi:hypothetical protein